MQNNSMLTQNIGCLKAYLLDFHRIFTFHFQASFYGEIRYCKCLYEGLGVMLMANSLVILACTLFSGILTALSECQGSFFPQ